MILIEHLARLTEIKVVVRTDIPRQVEQPVQVGAGNNVLGGAGRHALQARNFAFGLLARLLGQVRCLQATAQLGDFGGVLISFTQLTLDRLELLAQHIFALAFRHLFLRLAPDRQDFALAFEETEHLAQTFLYIERIEHELLLFRLEVQICRDQVRQHAGLGGVGSDDRQFIGERRG